MGKNELYHWKYIDKKKVNGKWRYIYDNKGTLTKVKKYREYDVDEHKFYDTTKRTIETDSLFTPGNKTEKYVDEKGEEQKIVTDYDGKVERTVEAGANFIASVLQKAAADIAFKRAANDILKEYKKKAGIH